MTTRNQPNRRTFLRIAAGLAASPALAAHAFRIDTGGALFNPCGELGAELRNHDFTLSAFAGLNWNDVWDSHAHLLGMGESGSGAWVSPEMTSPINIRQYAQFRFYLNAACVKHGNGNSDSDFLARLLRLTHDFPDGYRAMILAFDRTHAEGGTVQPRTLRLLFTQSIRRERGREKRLARAVGRLDSSVPRGCATGRCRGCSARRSGSEMVAASDGH